MARIDIRDIDKSVAVKLGEIAKSKGMSREKYLRDLLEEISSGETLHNYENKYANLVETLADHIKMQNDIIEKNNLLYEKMLEVLFNIRSTEE